MAAAATTMTLAHQPSVSHQVGGIDLGCYMNAVHIDQPINYTFICIDSRVNKNKGYLDDSSNWTC